MFKLTKLRNKTDMLFNYT